MVSEMVLKVRAEQATFVHSLSDGADIHILLSCLSSCGTNSAEIKV